MLPGATSAYLVLVNTTSRQHPIRRTFHARQDPVSSPFLFASAGIGNSGHSSIKLRAGEMTAVAR